MTEKIKTCTRCHQPKPLSDFKSDSRKPDGKASSCKACNAAPKVGELPIANSRALVPVFDQSDPKAWAARISERWRSSVEAIIDTGRILVDAKAALPHGAFAGMCESDLPFSQRTAQRLMAIAEDGRLSNPTIASLLPASWTVLYDLTTLSDDELQSAVEGETIRSDMTRKDVAAIKPPRAAIVVENLPRDDAGKLTPEARKALGPVIKEIRAEKQIEKKERRDQRESDLAEKLLALPEKKFGVAIEDFEWDHEPWSRDSGMDRHPSNHYPTATDAHTPEEIVARTAERFECLADDCVLYMWTTIPHEAIAHEVLRLRGFKYVTQRVWGKLRKGDGRGPGYWVTGEHEILLIAVRGNVVPPATAVFRSFFIAAVREHSEKPDEQYEHAEFHFPNLPKIELNARRGRVGWTPWGFDAPVGQADLPAREEESAA